MGVTGFINNPNKIIDIIDNTQNPRNMLLLAIGFFSGFRISDILELKYRDICGEHIEIFEQKTGKIRKVIINHYLQTYITKYFILSDIGEMKQESDEYIFTSQKSHNKPMTRQQAWRIIVKECKKHNVQCKIGTHTMRKSAARMIYNANQNNIMIVREFLNHDSLQDTYQYIAIPLNLDNAVKNVARYFEKNVK